MPDTLYEKAYNPDVLTCIANLSNDEVFTPPSVANAMLDLLPQEIFSNPDAKFLDPACKSGVFLREIAKRLLEGLKDKIPDLQERIDHIFKTQLYGIAITELTSLLSRRSVYCSKYPNCKYSVTQFDNPQGNIFFNNTKTKHLWIGGKCLHCGASEKEYGDEARQGLERHAYQFIHNAIPGELENMKFDVIIGNPPYQLSDGGAQASASPLYHFFVQQAQKLKPRYLVMIIPARWYSGGKGTDIKKFREKMINDTSIRELHDFVDATDCFSGVDIKGGICYFLWDRDNKGLCKVFNHEKGDVVSTQERLLKEPGSDFLIRSNESISILHKIQARKEKPFSSIVHSAMTFGFRTFFKEFDSETEKKGMTKVYANHSVGYIETKKIKHGIEYINSWKVYLPEAIGSGDSRTDIFKPILGEPNTISTETYIMNGPYKTKNEAENVCEYIKTKFFHFLVGLLKNTQHTTQTVYQFVPLQDFSKSWTDEELYAKYKLSPEEINFIESMIRPME
ncbi:MAG: Eco57I restriction-modification methylase domain-containing protein [Treponema sp.]|nr:Eco57I restriction-modification methylase domain-containing protein [Treponema sp.]